MDELETQPPQAPPKEGVANAQDPKGEKCLFVWNCYTVEMEDI